MYYKLKDNIALRSWQFVPRAYYVKNSPYAKSLTEEEFNRLIKCNGKYDITLDNIVLNLEQRGLIDKCYPGAKTSEWSRHKSYSHRYFPKMNFMITGKCNYNCLHCFNAADNSPIMTEWKYSDILHLLDQASDCGIHAFTITSGEPMMHPRFLDVISAIHKRNMFVEDINTNGYFITKQMLDEFKKMGCKPLIKISFDGLGYHDWMRNHKGAEDKTVNAIKTCIKNGFTVMAQTQVHQKNLHTLIPTAQMLNDIGVKTMRLIRTTEVARWQKNAPDSCIPIEEYYQNMLDFMQEYKNSRINMQIIVWQFIRLDPMSHSYKLDAVLCPSGNFNPADPICKGNRGMIGVTSDGDVVPCLQMSGYYEEHGINLGNLHDTPLREILNGGDYLTEVCTNLHKFCEANKKCRECKYWRWCNGGCPALGLLFTGNRKGSNSSKCLFYEHDWYHKIEKIMDGWQNLSRINF